MTFPDLFETLTTRGVLPRAKECKTALRYLARALGAPSWDECHVDAACLKETSWDTVLEAHFAQRKTKGANRRNIRSNLRTVFKIAEAQGLLPVPLPTPLLTTRSRASVICQLRATPLYRTTYRPPNSPRYFGLPTAQWPPDVVQGWRDYQVRCWDYQARGAGAFVRRRLKPMRSA